jgi:hypothetical protein
MIEKTQECRMQDQKLEVLLNLALSATPEEREKSGNLNVGYNPEEKTWDVIVKHSGDISNLSLIGNPGGANGKRILYTYSSGIPY